MIDWCVRARTLVRELTERGLLADERWRAAFEAVPRHVFVPRFYDRDGMVIDSNDPAHRAAYLNAVYGDIALTTQVAPVPGTDALSVPTSSSTRPSLMARMLDLLEVSDGHRILEIGTGTGYNAALLCYRLTDARVASIDIDPVLVADARDHLASVGYRPLLLAGDGAAGIPGAVPYDRIIATCAVPAIPPGWIAQLAPDGMIVADVRGELASNLIALRRTDEQTVQGRFLAHPGHFMWLRATVNNPLRDGGALGTAWSLDAVRHRTTALDPAQLDEPDLRFVLQLLAPDIHALYRTDQDGAGVVHLHADDGSWTEVATVAQRDRYSVTEQGPRALWAVAERAVEFWIRYGRPACTRFGLTATADGTQQIWLDDPSGFLQEHVPS